MFWLPYWKYLFILSHDCWAPWSSPYQSSLLNPLQFRPQLIKQYVLKRKKQVGGITISRVWHPLRLLQFLASTSLLDDWCGPWPRDVLKEVSRGLSRVEAGNPGFPRLVQLTSGGFSWWLWEVRETGTTYPLLHDFLAALFLPQGLYVSCLLHLQSFPPSSSTVWLILLLCDSIQTSLSQNILSWTPV